MTSHANYRHVRFTCSDSEFGGGGYRERCYVHRRESTSDSCTIITTEANDIVAPIHDRMPLILERDREERWLFTDEVQERKVLLKPYPGQDSTVYPISTRVNDPAHDSPEILIEVDDQGGQSGLGDFT